MNKTISINLGGRNFFIEEDAFKKLDGYLTAIKAHFAAIPGSGEIVADMEARIAEKFLEKSQDNPQAVITNEDVEKLIKDLGSVEDITGEAGEGQKSSGQKDSSAFGQKRLMRNGENKIVAGVASGLAAYFDWDPFWVRLVFGILFFAWGAIIPIYFLLWFIMPEAKSVTEKMQMRGEPVNLDSISETIKERANEFKEHVEDFRSKKKDSKAKGEFKNFVSEVAGGIGRAIGFFFKVLGKILGFVVVVASGFAIAMLTTAVVFMLFNIRSPYVGFPLSVLPHGWPYYVLLVAAYVVVLMPLLLIMLLSISLFNRRKVLTSQVSAAFFGNWLLALVVIAAIGGRYIPDYVQQVKNSPQLQVVNKEWFDIRDFSKLDLSNSIDYKLIEGPEYKITASGWTMDLDRLEVNKEEGGLLKISRTSQNFCFFCFQGNTKVEITAPSFESITARNSSNVAMPSLTATSTTINLSNSSDAAINFKGKNLNVNLLNSSFLKAEGASDTLIAKMQNSSHLDSRGLEVKTAEITTGNSSRANVWVTDVLKYNSFNSSWITYLGDPVLEGTSKTVPTKDTGMSNYQNEEDFMESIPPVAPEMQ